MYKIYADNTLIYDSTVEDFKIGKGEITLEVNKSGSFVFSVYPDHFYYDNFIKMKTVIKVTKDSKIVFRGRILNDVTDYFNNKVITCEGEMGFLQDSIIRPFDFSGTPEVLFKKFVNEHNSQVDDFKKFKIGTVTVTDPNNYIARSNSAYETALSNLNSRLIEDSLGGYFYITHDNSDIPTLHYLADFTNVATQVIEFGQNLKDYTKTTKADDIATAIIPLGATIDDGNSETEDPRLTIASVNGGKDYVYDESAVALRGWIFKTVTWDDVTKASILKSKAEEYLNSVINQNITIELNAIDLHLLDKSIESFNVCDYIRVYSVPHNFDATLLCNKQTINLLNPENDTIILGYSYSTFTEVNSKISNRVSNIINIGSTVSRISSQVNNLNNGYSEVQGGVEEIRTIISNLELDSYPVGSVYVGSNNVNPSTLMGGTWELFDKSLTYHYYNDTGDLGLLTLEDKVNAYSISVVSHNRQITVRIILTLANDISSTFTNGKLATIDFTKLGLSRVSHTSYIACPIGSGGKSSSFVTLGYTGSIALSAVYPATNGATIPAGSVVYVVDTLPVGNMANIDDSYCDKFYWRRIA